MLNDTKLRGAKPKDRPYKLGDYDGLSLLVQPTGSKWWRFRYHFAGKEKMLSLGTYPEVSLRDARDRRDAARKQVAAGLDPSNERKQEKRAQAATIAHSFHALANEWYSYREATWALNTRTKIRFYLDRDLLPALGPRSVPEITRPELVDLLRQIEGRKAFNVAKKARGWLNQIFRYALVKGVIERNPATNLEVVAARAPRSKPHASLDAKELPGMLKALDAYRGSPLTRYTIRLLHLSQSLGSSGPNKAGRSLQD
jgi:hypothetical protein